MTSDWAAISHLRAVAKVVVENKPGQHKSDCHCHYCVTEHALAATSGYDQEPDIEGHICAPSWQQRPLPGDGSGC